MVLFKLTNRYYNSIFIIKFNLLIGIALLSVSDNYGITVNNLNLKGDVNGDCRIGLEEAIFALQKVGCRDKRSVSESGCRERIER